VGQRSDEKKALTAEKKAPMEKKTGKRLPAKKKAARKMR
jgi:hypothetical protein